MINTTRMGQWINEDGTIGEPDPSNATRYVGNDPLKYADPTGLFRVSKGVSVGIRNGNRDPAEKTTEQDNIRGLFWIFHFEQGDSPHIAQKVQVTGVFSVTEKLKNGKSVNHAVEWSESYIEAWARPQDGTISDLHAARAEKPALYIQQKIGHQFVKEGRGDLILFPLKGAPPPKKDCREITAWSFNMTAIFTLVNGTYPNWDVALDLLDEPIFVSEPVDFRITKLTLNSEDQPGAQPIPGVFSSYLRPTGSKLPFQNLPTAGVTKTLSNTTKWDLQWNQGEQYPKIDFDPGEYK